MNQFLWKSNFRGKKKSTVIQRMLYISCYVSCQSIVQEAIRMSCVVICKTQQLHWFVTIKATSTSPQLLHLQDFLKTFTVRESARKWSVTFSLMAQLRSVIRMICLTTGWAWFYNQRLSYANSLQFGGKSLKSFEECNFLRLRNH